MAKVTGPLMSMSASGAFAGSMVFGGWKGRNTVRALVTPSNPQSLLQTNVRNAMRVLASAQKFVNHCVLKRAGQTKTDQAALVDVTPAGQAWNGFLVKSGVGAGQVYFAAAAAAYAALTNPEKAAWDTAAAALVPAILPVAQSVAGGASGAPLPAGQVFFHTVYALYIAGVATIPGAVPPVYA